MMADLVYFKGLTVSVIDGTFKSHQTVTIEVYLIVININQSINQLLENAITILKVFEILMKITKTNSF